MTGTASAGTKLNVSGSERRLAAILSADVAGYSRLMADDEAATVRTLSAYREEITALLGLHRGRLVDFTGDNFLAEFPSALDGMRCAIEIQRALAIRNEGLPTHRRMEFRIGLHLGDVRIEAERIYGDGVNIASRLEGLAQPGGICISGNLHDLIRGKLDLSYRDLGEQRVKNIPQPVRAFRVVVGAASRHPIRAMDFRRVARFALALVALALGATVLWQSINQEPSSETLLALPKGPSIAVLPFENASGDPEQEYFSDGLTEDIITNLTKFEELFVIARHSTFQYKGYRARSGDVRDIGRDLGVRYILEGSVRKAGERIRVTAQLSDASDGRHLWGETYDRDLTASNLFRLQDELTQTVVGAITGTYGALSRAGLAEARRKTTENLEAYDCVLRTYEYLQIHTAGKHLVARKCLERAVKLDPDYPDAWAWLGYTYAEENRHQWNAEPEPLQRALAVTNRAVGLDGANQVAHGVLALIYFGRGEFDRFTAEAEKTVSLNPNNALWLAILGSYTAPLGNWERGLSMVKKALALNPNPPDWVYIPFFLDHYRSGRYAAALREAQKITTEDVYRNQLFLAAAYGQLGRRVEAGEVIRKLLAIRPDFPTSVREDLRRRYGYPEELTEQLMSGLRKAGLSE